MKHHPIMLFFLPKDWWSIVPSCFTSLQPYHAHWWSQSAHVSHPYSHVTYTDGSILLLCSHTYLTATSYPKVEPPTIIFTHLQPHHTQLWSLLPSCSHTYSHITPNCGASHTYSHITPNCGASYHHVHTLKATSHPIVEPPTIMFTHLQPCHTQRWSIFTPVIHIHFTPWYVLNSHTYIHVTLNDGDCLSRLGFQHKQLVDLKHIQHRSAFTQSCI